MKDMETLLRAFAEIKPPIEVRRAFSKDGTQADAETFWFLLTEPNGDGVNAYEGVNIVDNTLKDYELSRKQWDSMTKRFPQFEKLKNTYLCDFAAFQALSHGFRQCLFVTTLTAAFYALSAVDENYPGINRLATKFAALPRHRKMLLFAQTLLQAKKLLGFDCVYRIYEKLTAKSVPQSMLSNRQVAATLLDKVVSSEITPELLNFMVLTINVEVAEHFLRDADKRAEFLRQQIMPETSPGFKPSNN